MVHVLDFFIINSGSPCGTQSSIIFSGLNVHQESLVELFVQNVVGDLVHQNRILFEYDENNSLYCSVDLSLTSTLRHSSQNLLLPLFLSVCTLFPEAGSLCFLSEEQTHLEKSAKQRFHTLQKNIEPSSVLVCGFRDVRDAIVVWIVDGRRVIIRTNHLVKLVGLITCGMGHVGHVAKVLLTVAEVRWTRAFWVGISPARVYECQGLERGVEEVVRGQRRGRVIHESGEGEMERHDRRMQQAFFMCLSQTCVHAWKCTSCTQKNVRTTGGVCTPSVDGHMRQLKWPEVELYLETENLDEDFSRSSIDIPFDKLKSEI